MAIPLITHQIWLQGWSKIPPKYAENAKELKALNPEFKHMRWDEDSLRTECEFLGKPYADKFNSFQNFMAKVDFGRYITLYRYGGFSIDTDMKPLAPLKNTPGLSTAEFIVSKLPFPVGLTGYVNNALFIVRPRHPIIKEMLDAIVRSTKTESDYSSKELYIDSETGPSFVNRILEKHKTRIVVIDNEYFEPCYHVDPYCKPTKKSIMDHQHSLSWISPMIQLLFRAVFFILRFGVPLLLLGVTVYFLARRDCRVTRH